ncbi:MAG: nitroreductase family protein [Thermotaleaceae bacterium]
MLEQIQMRRSVRKYIDKPVEDEKLMEILESARVAPSGSNTQPWHFIIVKSQEGREKLAEISHNQKWMVEAPVFIVCVADIGVRIKGERELFLDENSPHSELKQIIRDTSIAIEHMVLEAENQGLNTCWIAWFTQEAIRPVLNIPSDKYVVAILTLGYGSEKPQMRPRKALTQILRYESW